MARYYAFAHTYGAHMRQDSGARIGLMVYFSTEAARDSWVAAATEYRTQPRYRVPIDSGDPDIARHSNDAQDGDHLPLELYDWLGEQRP